MKRTERDDSILERIQKNIKKEEDENQLDKLKIPLPWLKQEEVDSLMESIEEYTVEQFSKYKITTFFSFTAWQPKINYISDIFLKCSPYLKWIGNYDRLMTIYCTDTQKQFANDWMKREIRSFLGAITTIWNCNHKAFIMSINDDALSLRITQIK